jgi:hypothetical protein
LNIRGREDIGSTFNGVLQRYADILSSNDSILILSGVSERVYDQLARTRALRAIDKEHVFLATPQLGQSLNLALRAARTWVAEHDEEE